MSKGRWALLFLIGLVVSLLAAWQITSPGYMDAEYYYVTARQLSSGEGFTEWFLWNYLDDPAGLPHPSHLYWMPLTSIVAAVPQTILQMGFRFAQAPFILLTALLPLFVCRLALWLRASPRQAWLSGLLAAFSGFYLPYMVTTDSFSLYALIGGGVLWASAQASQLRIARHWFFVGALLGLANLARADGLIFLGPALLALWWSGHQRIKGLVTLLSGYIVAMSPWWLRSLGATGSLFPIGVNRALWLVSYDDLFSYPASLLTAERWWQSGLGTILATRVQAFGHNSASLLAVSGLVFLAPLMVVGAIRMWQRPLVRLGVVYLALLLGVMTLVFPLPGARGGFFHSSAALMPLLWVLAAEGLETATRWGAKRRGWVLEQANRFFHASAVGLACLLTLAIVFVRVIGKDFSHPQWGRDLGTYELVADRLNELDPQARRVVVNNPPGFNLATGLQALVVPNGDEETLRQVVERYDADWVILEANHPQALDAIYREQRVPSWLELADAMSAGSEGRILLLRVSEEGLTR